MVEDSARLLMPSRALPSLPDLICRPGIYPSPILAAIRAIFPVFTLPVVQELCVKGFSSERDAAGLWTDFLRVRASRLGLSAHVVLEPVTAGALAHRAADACGLLGRGLQWKVGRFRECERGTTPLARTDRSFMLDLEYPLLGRQ